MLGGCAGIGQLWLPWFDRDGQSLSGWDVFTGQRAIAQAAGGSVETIGAYAIVAVVVIGVAVVLLGTMIFARIDHRPPAVAALIGGLVAVAAAVYWLSWRGGSPSIGDLFAVGSVGWFCFLAAGPITVLGSIKALISGR